MNTLCYFVDVYLFVLFILLLMFLALALIASFAAFLQSASENVEGVSEQINRISTEAKEEMDRVSDKYIRQVYEQINQGEK